MDNTEHRSDDTEGHRPSPRHDAPIDDAEGHGIRGPAPSEVVDDAEGHGRKIPAPSEVVEDAEGHGRMSG